MKIRIPDGMTASQADKICCRLAQRYNVSLYGDNGKWTIEAR